jgi:putative membrane protein
MVKLSPRDHATVADAIRRANAKTETEIRIAILPASDDFAEFVMLYGLLVSSLFDLGLWSAGVTDNLAVFIAVQFGTMLLFYFIPFLRRLCIGFVPKKVRYHRAETAAFAEYHARHSGPAQSRPLVLLFISLAERYVRLIANEKAHVVAPHDWAGITDHFVLHIRKGGLLKACEEAIHRLGELLAPHLPNKG